METGRLISRHVRYILSYSVCYPLQFCVEEWIKNIKKFCYMNMKRLTLAIVIFLGICINIDAQDVVKHVVKRGETLSSIAKQYGTTEQEIKNLNPNVKTVIYAGLELNMPVANEKENEQIDLSKEDKTSSYHKDNIQQDRSDSKITPWSFSSYGVSYLASFDYADQGYYLLGGAVYSDDNWGFDMQMGWNIGLVEQGYEGFMFMIGPAYACQMGNALLSSSFDFYGVWSGTGPSEVRKQLNIDKENTFGWGFTLEPKITLKLGKVFPWAGLPIQWAKGSSKLGVGFHIGLSFGF